MNKSEFLKQLQKHLSGLSKEERQRILDDFSEGIDDRMEEGLSEAEAVAAMGNLDEIAAQFMPNSPSVRPHKKRTPARRKLSGLEIVLLTLGFPLWFPLLLAAAALVFTVVLVLWVLVLVLYIIDLALAVSNLGFLLIAVYYFARGSVGEGILSIGCALVVGGLAMLLFPGCNYTAKGMWWLTKATAIGFKNCIFGKRY